jgi:hypothetical protein
MEGGACRGLNPFPAFKARDESSWIIDAGGRFHDHACHANCVNGNFRPHLTNFRAILR